MNLNYPEIDPKYVFRNILGIQPRCLSETLTYTG